MAGRLKRTLESTETHRLNQQQLHAYVDDLQTTIGELHAEISRTWFPPPVGSEAAA